MVLHNHSEALHTKDHHFALCSFNDNWSGYKIPGDLFLVSTPLNPSTGGLLLSSVIINYPCSLNIICPLGNHFSFEALNLPTLCLLVDFLPLFIFLDHLPQNLERILHSQFFLILRFLWYQDFYLYVPYILTFFT